MAEQQTLGTWLRREREHRGISLRTISEQTKVSYPLLEGLEADDISRWPSGIFRRAFVRSYAECVGIDADEVVRRFEQQHADIGAVEVPPEPGGAGALPVAVPGATGNSTGTASVRGRFPAVTADLTVALVIGLGAAAAGSRLLWPVLLIALYHAVGVLLTGTTPMTALLRGTAPAAQPPAPAQPEHVAGARPPIERRHTPRRPGHRPGRQPRTIRQRLQ